MRDDIAAIETVAIFDPTHGEHPENVALTADGTIYVTLHRATTLWKRAGNGTVSRLTLPVPIPANGETRVNGIVIAGDGTVFVAVRSDLPALSGVWHVRDDGTMGKHVDLPPNAGLNGMAMDHQGALYLADDTLGCIWRIAPRSATAAVWVADSRLAPQGSSAYGFRVYGANGIKVHHGAVYVSNSSTANVLRIPVDHDGTSGVVTSPYPGGIFHNIDDFAFDAAGNLYFTTVVDHTVERVTPAGVGHVVLTHAHGLDMPTAVAFGERESDRTHLYVTNAAFWTPPGVTPHASLMRCDLGMPGEPLR